MRYTISIQVNLEKVLKRIPKKDKDKISAFIDNLAVSDNPLINAKKLSGLDELYRYRVGNYRILCKVNNNELIILVLDINHRKDIYRNL